MRRNTRRSKPVDSRQFDLFASSAVTPTVSQTTLSPPLSKPVSHEKILLDAIVDRMQRQWREYSRSDFVRR